MENNQTQEPIINPQPVVTFPSATPKKGMPKWPFAAGGVLLILGIGGYFLMQAGGNSSTEDATPTPFVSGINNIATPDATSTPTPTASATPAPSPVSDSLRGSTAIEIQNGTGTAGDAGVAKKALDTLGYKKVTTGNASSDTATQTTITYSSDTPMSVVSEITTALESVFQSVTAQKGTLSGTASVRVVTGPKKAADAMSKASPTASAKATATPKPTATATSSAKPTSSPN
jgi:hypothetical protein